MHPTRAALVLCVLAACRAPASERAERTTLSGGLTAEAPAAWTALEPGSSMRAAEYRVPGPGGDASLIVYHFGRSGGSVADNVERWTGQFEAPGGGPATPALAELHTDAGLAVHELRIEGRYVAAVRPGAAERHDEPGWRMLAAIVETPAGAYYPKLVGPAATVRANEAAWDAYLAALGFEAE